MNLILEQYLRRFFTAKQDDWVSWLILVQFTYNKNLHPSTNVSLFKANYGFHPQVMLGAPTGEVQAVDEMV